MAKPEPLKGKVLTTEYAEVELPNKGIVCSDGKTKILLYSDVSSAVEWLKVALVDVFPTFSYHKAIEVIDEAFEDVKKELDNGKE